MMKRMTTWLFSMLPLFWCSSASAQTAAQTVAGKTPKNPVPEWQQLFNEFLTWDVFDIPVWRITVCVLVLMLGLVLKNGLINRLLRPLDRLLDRTQTTLDNALLETVRRPGSWLVFIVALYLALEVLQLPPGVASLTTLLLQTAGTAVIAWWLFLTIDVAGVGLQKFVDQTESDVDDHIVPLVKRVLRVVLVCFAGVAIIQQWGYDVTSLVAGLGIGGIAFALAAQDTLSNWFGSLMIFTDRPFRLGDWVKSGVIEGVVEEVGLRSTKVRTFDRSLVTVPNKKIANDTVENFTMREMRRINLTIGLEYRTTRAQMEQILAGIRTLLAEHALVDPATINVFFTGLGESTLDVLVQAFFRTNSWAEFAPAREELLLEIMGIVEAAGTGFAFPSRSLYVETPLQTRAA